MPSLPDEIPSYRFFLVLRGAAHALSVRPPCHVQRVGHEQQQHQRVLGGTARAEREDRLLPAPVRRRVRASGERDGVHPHRPRQEFEIYYKLKGNLIG